MPLEHSPAGSNKSLHKTRDDLSSSTNESPVHITGSPMKSTLDSVKSKLKLQASEDLLPANPDDTTDSLFNSNVALNDDPSALVNEYQRFKIRQEQEKLQFLQNNPLPPVARVDDRYGLYSSISDKNIPGQGVPHPSLRDYSHNFAAPISSEPTTRLAFVTGEELLKFKGNKRPMETLFTPGPSINDFLSSFAAYCARHGLVSSSDKVLALKMNVHPSQGDAFLTLSSILDSSLNKDTISFEDISDYLSDIYRPISNLNVFRATKSFVKRINDCAEDSFKGNPIETLRSLELSAKELVQTFTQRKDFNRNNKKNPEDSMIELLIAMSFSMYVGEETSNKFIEDLPANIPPRSILLRAHNQIRKSQIKKSPSTDYVAVVDSNPAEMRASRPRNPSYGLGHKNSNFRSNTPGRHLKKDEYNSNFNHSNQNCYFCNGFHTSENCRRRESINCSFCKIKGHNVMACRKFRKQKQRPTFY